MIEFSDRDPVTFQVSGLTTQTSPLLMPALQPRRRNEVWVCEYVSVWITEHTSNADPDAYLVELGIDHGSHIIWLDYINLTSGRWTRILNSPITLLANMLPRCRFYCTDANLIPRMNAVGYIRAPFTTP